MSDRGSAEGGPDAKPAEVERPLGGRRRGGVEELPPEPFFERELRPD